MEFIDPQDWITIWQSEMSALAVDQEYHEAITAASTAWTGLLRDARNDQPAGRASPDAPPRPAPVGPASRPGDDVERLQRRIAELERSLAAATPAKS
ncbi:hypothetical protein [Acidisphaera sp. L21]|uniref:hypothetical protein n=1 Tax=Acidisphaera sp. L21 TaxID=1641851 RepID=UPI0020B12524|nr:hypothetical protein [Acidisphaera sp. L21]